LQKALKLFLNTGRNLCPDIAWILFYLAMLIVLCRPYRLPHLKRNPTTITYYGTKKSESRPPPCNRLFQTRPWHSSQGHSCCWATAHASCAKAVQLRTWCYNELNVSSLSKITSHRHSLPLFVKHLTLRFLTSMSRTTTCRLLFERI
jgi:hypothetical protein